MAAEKVIIVGWVIVLDGDTYLRDDHERFYELDFTDNPKSEQMVRDQEDRRVEITGFLYQTTYQTRPSLMVGEYRLAPCDEMTLSVYRRSKSKINHALVLDKYGDR